MPDAGCSLRSDAGWKTGSRRSSPASGIRHPASDFEMDERRTLRVSEAVREELAEIIGFELEDPKLLAVDVTEVHVSPDSRHASVKVAVRGTEREQAQALAALEHAQAFLRRQLASRLQLRRVPELHFDRDKNPNVESRIDFLLKRVKKSRRRTEN
jgi:ribosome-binding factor A